LQTTLMVAAAKGPASGPCQLTIGWGVLSGLQLPNYLDLPLGFVVDVVEMLVDQRINEPDAACVGLPDKGSAPATHRLRRERTRASRARRHA